MYRSHKYIYIYIFCYIFSWCLKPIRANLYIIRCSLYIICSIYIIYIQFFIVPAVSVLLIVKTQKQKINPGSILKILIPHSVSPPKLLPLATGKEQRQKDIIFLVFLVFFSLKNSTLVCCCLFLTLLFFFNLS